MVEIFVDNQPFQVEEEQNLLEALLTLGFDLPYFCWHPALGSVGACRQCAVKQFRSAEDHEGSIVMACMTPVFEGLRVSVHDEEVREFRAAVIGWLMSNHPHDCPVCDEGGECHLQDMTVMTGHTYRRFRFKKRTFVNQDLGPFIHHEMNRCIQCYRCVRYYRDLAGGTDFNVFASRNNTYFGRSAPGVLESPFSGNLVEICPTGVFTDKTLKEHYTRKWDLQSAPSLCIHCGLGCNTLPGEREGVVRRVLNRYHPAVNGYFLCDRGRFGYEFINASSRINEPWIKERGTGQRRPVGVDEALQRAVTILGESRLVVGIGSPRASLEANYALRTLVGGANFFSGLASEEAFLLETALGILVEGGVRISSLAEIGQADAVVVLGEDVANTAPLVMLALRQAVRQVPLEKSRSLAIPDWNDAYRRLVTGDEKSPLFVASVYATDLDEIATLTLRAAPADIARFGFALAHQLDPQAPRVEELSEDFSDLVQKVAEALGGAQRPLVVAGTGSGTTETLLAAANVAYALAGRGQAAQIFLTMPECNSLGLGILQAQDFDAALSLVEEGGADTVIVLENDLIRRVGPGRVAALLTYAKRVIVIDHTTRRITEKADLVLPAATFAECNGTLVNNEGRAQRFLQVARPVETVRSAWRWCSELAARLLGHPDGAGPLEREGLSRAAAWQGIDDVGRALAADVPALAPVTDLTPPPSFRLAGKKVPRQSHRHSGRTALSAHRQVSEPKPPEDSETPLCFSMEGTSLKPPPELIARYWSPGWNSVQALNKFQHEVGGPLRGGDPGRRLIEPRPRSEGEPYPYSGGIPGPFVPRPGHWLAAPIDFVFGSEELSVLAPAVAALVPEPHAAVCAADLDEIGAQVDDVVEVELAGIVYRLPLRLNASLPRGVVGVPIGLAPGVIRGREAWTKVVLVS